jgi:hypothetical protein
MAAPVEKKGLPEAAMSKETAACVECHKVFNPGIVEDWQKSRHATVTPGQALGKRPLERRVSAENIAPELQNAVVGCYECHGLNTSAQRDTFEHFDTKINAIVSPKDCATCHPLEAQQYSRSKKAFALPNLDKNPVYSLLVGTATNTKAFKDGILISVGSSANAKNETCYACHSSNWAGRHFDKSYATVKEADGMVLASTDLMREAWKRKAADDANPFDEALEQKWVTQWLIYANSVRYSSAMGGPDHATFKNGWWGLTKTLEEMREYLKIRKEK